MYRLDELLLPTCNRFAGAKAKAPAWIQRLQAMHLVKCLMFPSSSAKGSVRMASVTMHMNLKGSHRQSRDGLLIVGSWGFGLACVIDDVSGIRHLESCCCKNVFCDQIRVLFFTADALQLRDHETTKNHIVVSFFRPHCLQLEDTKVDNEVARKNRCGYCHRFYSRSLYATTLGDATKHQNDK